jgi:hypothetical protein
MDQYEQQINFSQPSTCEGEFHIEQKINGTAVSKDNGSENTNHGTTIIQPLSNDSTLTNSALYDNVCDEF